MAEKTVKAVALQGFTLGGKKFKRGDVAEFTEEQVGRLPEFLSVNLAAHEDKTIGKLEKEIEDLKKKLSEAEKNKAVKSGDVKKK